MHQNMSLIPLFLTVLLTILHIAHTVPQATSPLKTQSILIYQRVGISNVNHAIRSLRFPDLIPLLLGNSILEFHTKSNSIFLSFPNQQTLKLYALRTKRMDKPISGFIFKKSSLHLYPVPMENTVLIVRLNRISPTFGILHFWIICRGVYTRKQRYRQKLFVKALLKDYADNAQRVLGVRLCSPFLPSLSGLCNNPTNSYSGVSFQELIRPMPLKRIPTPNLINISPPVRQVSNVICKETKQINAPMRTNMFMIYFGQFIDHDITLTPNEHSDENAKAPIQDVPNSGTMPFTRAGILRYSYRSCCRRRYSKRRVWEGNPFNVLTSFVDAGAVYGSHNIRANALRSFRRGKLILRRRNGELLLPLNRPGDVRFPLENEPDERDGSLFAAGDVRANENPMLLSIHTLFAKEHNRVCRLLQHWLRRTRRVKFITDEWLYNNARLIVIAELQSITFNEFVPAMIGSQALGKYTGYNPRIDARISTFHSSVAYRWGHSAIAEKMSIRDRKGNVQNRILKDMFFNTRVFMAHGLDNLVMAAMNNAASDVDEKIAESLRNFLFHTNNGPSLDLMAVNIQRSRDLGVPGYIALQRYFKTGTGLENIKPEVKSSLLGVYGDENKIDAFVGGLCEKKSQGSLMGPLFTAINAEQFKRLREGDRFYYENIKWNAAIRNMPLVRKIRRNAIRMHHIVYANTGITRRQVGIRESFFKTRFVF